MHSFFNVLKNESEAQPNILPCLSDSDIIFAHILGSGTFGEVYFGSVKGEPVAIKKILNTSDSVKEAEIILHGSLSHPNIVRAWARYNTPQPDNDVCLILEYMDGKDLLHYLMAPDQKTILSLNMRIGIIKNIIDALTYLHQTMHILHRDIKPDNILLDQRMQAKLCDFGLSTSIKKAKSLPPCGTLDYSAPELFNNTNCHHTEKTDIYAMGATVFTMITVTHPQKIHTIDMVKTMMATVDSVPLRTAKAFQNMVNNSTAYNPNDRISLADMSILIQTIDKSTIKVENKPTETRDVESSYTCTVS